MHGYSQPAGYRFSHDSIELAQRAAAFLQNRGGRHEVMDLCAGCGVVGLELLKMSTAVRTVDFVEVQEVYRTHFEQNLNWTRSSSGDDPQFPRVRWLQMGYQDLSTSSSTSFSAQYGSRYGSRYDVVVSNPPYFDRAQGNLPPSDFKARCRFFLDSDFETMWQSILHVLKPGGDALVLVRDLGDHGVDRTRELDRILASHGEWRWLEPIRGTGLVHFRSTKRP